MPACAVLPRGYVSFGTRLKATNKPATRSNPAGAFRTGLGAAAALCYAEAMKLAKGAPQTRACEPGWVQGAERSLQSVVSTPPRHHPKPTPKAKERPASKGRVHKGKTRN
jgi:hypothetical protein